MADSPHQADLELARACARGEPDAIAAFVTRFAALVDAAVARLSSHPADEIRQRLLAKLLAPQLGRAPHIGEYAGRGPLQAWVQVVIAREVIDVVREDERRRSSPETLERH